MLPEIYFLKYAFPCSHILCRIRNEITEEEFMRLEYSSINNIPLERKILERIFFRAFSRIEKVAQEMGRDKWDIGAIKEYFRVRHNLILDKLDYPESFKELCKVHEGEVTELLEDAILVKYSNKIRKVKKAYLQNIKPGDKVTIHWNYAVEKI